jgi:hypothetical protein
MSKADPYETLIATCEYEPGNKEAFHREARKQLKELGKLLTPRYGAYDVRSNKGGIAVSGEVTLHMEKLYVQVSHAPWRDHTQDILFRSCNGLRDYTGGPNNFADMSLLMRKDMLVKLIQERIKV